MRFSDQRIQTRERELLRRSSLRMADLWTQWLSYHLDVMDYEHGHERLLRDTAIVCMHNVLNCARRLRGNPGWGMGGTMRDDTVNLLAEMEEARAHYLRNRPKLDPSMNRLAPLFDVMDGLVNQQVRLAREIQEMRDEGALSLSVSTDPATAKTIREDYH